MLKAVKHRTTIALQSMKKGDGPACLNPYFPEAAAHLADYRAAVRLFIDDANQVLAIIPRIFKGLTEFTTATEKCYETFPEEDRALSAQLAQLTADMKVLIEARVGAPSAESVIKPLKDIAAQLEELEKLNKQQHDGFLILESNKAKIEGFQKEPEKNAQQIQSYTEKVTTRTTDVQNIEADFIAKMNETWANRFEALKVPLTALMAIVADIGEALMTSSGPIVNTLGPELIAKDYPVAEPPQPKGKK